MSTTRYQSIGSKAFSAGMMSKSHQEDLKETPVDPSAQSDAWWSHWDAKWINHYDEEWAAFIGQHPKLAEHPSDEDGMPCVWNRSYE